MSDMVTLRVEMDRGELACLAAYARLAGMQPSEVLKAALDAWLDTFEAALTPELRQEVQGIVARTYGSAAVAR